MASSFTLVKSLLQVLEPVIFMLKHYYIAKTIHMTLTMSIYQPEYTIDNIVTTISNNIVTAINNETSRQ